MRQGEQTGLQVKLLPAEHGGIGAPRDTRRHSATVYRFGSDGRRGEETRNPSGVTPFVVGLMIVAIGFSAPETISVLSLDGIIGFIDGMVLLAFLVVFIVSVYKVKIKDAPMSENEDGTEDSDVSAPYVCFRSSWGWRFFISVRTGSSGGPRALRRSRAHRT